jgi:hypothetical protein
VTRTRWSVTRDKMVRDQGDSNGAWCAPVHHGRRVIATRHGHDAVIASEQGPAAWGGPARARPTLSACHKRLAAAVRCGEMRARGAECATGLAAACAGPIAA